MMKYLFIIYLLPLAAMAQYKPPAIDISNRLLVWSDFKGNRPLDTFTAMTCWDLVRDTPVLTSTTKKSVFTAHAYFYPLESTVSQKYLAEKPDSLIRHLLNHEQKHYDLALVAAMQLNELYRNFLFDTSNAYQQADSIRNRVARAIVRLQYIYDTETRHSKDHIAQKRWDGIITDAMKKRKLPLDLIKTPFLRF